MHSPTLEHEPLDSAQDALLLTVNDVARRLRVSRSKVYALIESGRLAAHRLPAIRVTQIDLDHFLNGCRHSPRSEEPAIRTVKLRHLR
jgi:excisionase family DNA binding protein